MKATTVKTTWTDVCAIDDLVPGRGVAAMVAGEQVAIFLVEGDLYALGNQDPFSGAYVMSRGIVGTKAGVPKVASPMYKQTFDLRTGVCFEKPDVSIPVWAIRCIDGRIEVADPSGSSPGGSSLRHGVPTPFPSKRASTA